MSRTFPRNALRLAVAALIASTASSLHARELSFDDRVRAEEAIERVYYSHQIGATRPFDAVVPHEVAERKVRTYLAQSAALERRWHTVATARTLHAELRRMVSGTKMPGRLRELFAALGDDPVLVEECLARPVWAARLTQHFGEHDDAAAPDATRDPVDFVAAVAPEADPIPELVQSLERKAEGVPCVADDTWDNGSLDDAPFPVTYGQSVWTGSLMVAWGGGRYDPATDTWSTISKVAAPPFRFKGTAVWTGSVMIVWGGKWHGEGTNAGGRYDPIADTWALTTTIGAPAPRYDHTAVWTGNRMVVWGGYDTGIFGDGARYDPASDTWTPVSTIGAPAPRRIHTAIWTGSSMVVWGGIGAGALLNSGGKYDPAADTWTSTSVAGAPAARAHHSAVWTGQSMIVWGGMDTEYNPLDTGGRYDPAADAWSGPTAAASAPVPRMFHSAVWTGERMIVWGGSVDDEGTAVFDTGGSYDPAEDQWTPVSVASAPAPRFAHSAVWTGEQMITWGGVGSEETPTTGGRYDPATDSWTPTSVAAKPKVWNGYSVVWTGNQMIVWGGGTGGINTDTGARYDPIVDTWSSTSMVNAPASRSRHTAIWTGERMVVWGGQATAGTGGYLATGGQYDPLGDSWTPTTTLHAPAGRDRHTGVWTGDTMIVWGGNNPSALASGGRYVPATDTWLTPTATANAPSARNLHTAIWTGSRMIVWGGGNVNTPLDSGGRYDPIANAWSPTATAPAASPRTNHSAVWTGSRMIVWGGIGTGLAPLFTGAQYDPVNDAWSSTSTVGVPTRRSDHSAVWTGQSMIVWGGSDWPGTSGSPQALDTGGRYDPVANTWTPTSTVNAASVRTDHTAVWTGSLMLVWGGYFDPLDGGPALGGGRYALGLAVDDDGDGFSECAGDCNDVDAGAVARPAEVAGLTLAADKQTLAWTSAAPAAGSATVHDVLRGALGQPVGGAGEECIASGIAGSTTSDPDAPVAGFGFSYLVRGRNSCGAGAYGYQSDGTEGTSSVCP